MAYNEKKDSKRQKELNYYSSRKHSRELLLSYFKGGEAAVTAQELRVVFEMASFQTPFLQHDQAMQNSLYKLYILIELTEDLIE